MRLVRAAQVHERLVDHLNLFGKVGVRYVHHVHQKVGLARFVQRTLERIHEVGWQFADEANGVGQEEGQVADDDLAHSRVERGEEFVLGKNFGLGQ